MAHIFDRGDPPPKRTLTFTIEVTDEGRRRGPPFRVRRTFQNWRQIGTLVFDNAVISLQRRPCHPFHSSDLARRSERSGDRDTGPWTEIR